MILIKNPKIDHWKQFNNGIIDNQNKSIVMDRYPKKTPYIAYGGSSKLYDVLQAEGIELIQWRI